MTVPDNTTRFSDRAAFYHQYRPGYPASLLPFLTAEIGLTPAHVVADIGAGTGILTELFLRGGHTVYAVEPNEAMRRVAETRLASEPRFHAVAAAAEATTLPAGSIDLITAAQAFHWFDHGPTRHEWRRILRPDGYLLLIWNAWDVAQPFFERYQSLLGEYCADYKRTSRDNLHDQELNDFFGPAGCHKHQLTYTQRFDFDGLRGRLLSSSYTPLPGHPNHEPLLARLAELFAQYQVGGQLDFPYLTNIYYGQFS